MNTPTMPQTARCCSASTSALLVIDIQERLGNAMPTKVLNRVVQNSTLLLRSAALLEIPVLHTEQYPAGLGATLQPIAEAIGEGARTFEKTSFSCCGAPGFQAGLDQSGRRQAIITGMEAHVCVLQTALGLVAAGLDVFVVEDAICSRRLENYQNALDRLRQSGVIVVSAESVVFEWLGDASHPHFRAIQSLMR